LLPNDENKQRTLLNAYLLHQVMDELGNELRAPSDNLRAPLEAALILLEDAGAVRAAVVPEVKTVASTGSGKPGSPS
jgi:hypothetical protein